MFATGSNLTFAEFNVIMDYVCLAMFIIGGYIVGKYSR